MTTKPTVTPAATGEPRLAAVASWAVLAASFGLSAATWIAMARLAGFTTTLPLPGTDLVADLSWLMPVAVDGYVVVALVLWMAPVPHRVAHFAKVNTYAAAAVGIVAQSAYHAFAVWSAQPAGDREAWRAILAAVVGALPPAVAALAVHMRALIRRESQPTTEQQPAPAHTVAEKPTVEQPAPVAEQPAPVVVQPATQATAVPAPSAPVEQLAFNVDPPAQVVQPALVPVPASAFTRANGTPIRQEVNR